MARGRRTSFTIRLTPAERRTLLTWQRATTVPAGLARRARLLLLLADGMTITEAAATVGLSRRHSYKWIRRFMKDSKGSSTNLAVAIDLNRARIPSQNWMTCSHDQPALSRGEHGRG